MNRGKWRRERKYNPIKYASLGWTEPEDDEKKSGGLVRRKPLKAKRAIHNQPTKTKLRRTLNEEPKRYAVTPKVAIGLKARGRRGAQLESLRKPWRAAVYALWGERCIYLGCNSRGPFEVAHAYSKGAHPEWHVEIWNGFPACIPHHRTARKNLQFTPEWTKALQKCADEMRAAMDGRRPQPSWDELQDILIRELGL